MDILDYFDITNIEHLKAWQYLNIHGCWPIGFISENITFKNTLWNTLITYKLADAYIKLKLE